MLRDIPSCNVWFKTPPVPPLLQTTSPTIFSAIYKFIYQAPLPTEQTIPHMLTTEGLVQNSDFSLEALLSMEADAYPDVMSSFNGIDIPNYISGHKRHWYSLKNG